ncbi:uncharacterized protein C8Q71DRAFT_737658 [Rhodofomes roseus]|uniref:RING-type domain-containing protein n=1 Tax=Rhodofomes roseus TaxID=34475 RepID=A0A4Y9YFM3_9APHY|nr:uncharacterized protein C8Q71DRAFT_737658 [Rhodofomes roseus]KAH9841562.1 hypothetical protein C8Q71DRAFT_737658 [Rhodofomes roseus]TFY60493.1 hypothetical protein EVJ58_g5117 [Rhodofomes roseus]
MAQPTLRRRRSMTDFLRLQILRDADRAGLPSFVMEGILTHLESNAAYRKKLKKFTKGLPKLTKQNLASLDEADSQCPICLTSFSAILEEEEMALALDSPAHPVEQLGVTRFVDTCGHIFCRKDTLGWVNQGRTTCPTCRRPFIDPPEEVPSGGPTEAVLQPGVGPDGLPSVSRNQNFANIASLIMGIVDTIPQAEMEALHARVEAQETLRRDEERNRDANDREEFSSMYS